MKEEKRMLSSLEKAREAELNREYCRAAYNYKDAGELEKAAEIYMKYGETEYHGYLNAARIYINLHDGNRALDAYLRWIKAFYNGIGFKKEDNRDYCTALITEDMERLDSLSKLEEYVEACKGMKEVFHIDVYNNLIEMGYHKMAAEYMIGISEEFIETSVRYELAAKAYEQIGEWEKAGDCYLIISKDYDWHVKDAIRCFIKTDQKEKLIEAYMAAAEQEMKRENPYEDEVKQYFDSAAKVAEQLGLTEIAEEIYKKLGKHKKPKKRVKKSMTSQIECPECGTYNKPTSKYCKECGEQLSNNKKVCPDLDCGNENEPDAKFCEECGTQLE